MSVFMFYFLSSSEFLLLSAMAYDRYVSICKPLQYPAIMTTTTVSLLLCFAWLVPACYVSCGDVRRKAVQTCLPHLLVLMNCSVLITYDVVIVKLESDFPKTARFVMTLQIITYNPLCNPIIYGLKMKEISKHLKRLLRHMK
ncbi:olfactory receptor 6N2-like [Oreochromis niloticus]|uniref:olfactory receptor 6N2-like n=1 Tax=Oreochromis niloticus TaxID=8128 RepID=UPI000DF27586|nr:olfactory receptor 6N2-like [Oreochromis niloticus]